MSVWAHETARLKLRWIFVKIWIAELIYYNLSRKEYDALKPDKKIDEFT